MGDGDVADSAGSTRLRPSPPKRSFGDAATPSVAGAVLSVAAEVLFDSDAVAVGDDAGVDVDVGSGRGVNVGRGVGVAVAIGVGVDSGVARRIGVGVAVAVVSGVAIDFAVAAGEAAVTGAGDSASAGATEDVDLAVGVGVEVVVSARASVGFTKTFGGASGGGVASACIFTRTFSAACRSGIPSQPRSTTTLAMVSLTLRGRSTASPRAIKGAGMMMASPRTTGRGSPTFTLTLISRSSRNRSTGC